MTTPRTRTRPARQRQRGVAAVEFGILLAPMVLMACGVAEFGRAVYQYDTLTKATRSAVRYLSQFSPDDVTYPTAVATAKCLAAYGNSACSGQPLAPGLATSMIVICDRVDASGCPGQSFNNVNTYDNPGGTGTPAGTVNLVAVRITGFAYAPMQSFINVAGLTFGDITTVMRQVL